MSKNNPLPKGEGFKLSTNINYYGYGDCNDITGGYLRHEEKGERHPAGHIVEGAGQ